MPPEGLSDRLIDFAVEVGVLVEMLPATHLGDHTARQLIRSGTSPAANYAEACAAESRKDFVHKLQIALKEMRETSIWLQIIKRGYLARAEHIDGLVDECDQLARILGKSVVTTKRNGAPRS